MSSGKWEPFCLGLSMLTHWYLFAVKQMQSNPITGIWWSHLVSKVLVSIGSGNSLSPVQCEAITWTGMRVFRIFPDFLIFQGIKNPEINTNHAEFSHFKQKYCKNCTMIISFRISLKSLLSCLREPVLTCCQLDCEKRFYEILFEILKFSSKKRYLKTSTK